VSKSYRIGESLFAIRSTSKEFGLWLDEALGTYRSDEIGAVRYSIVIAGEPDGTTKELFHVVYRGTVAMVKATNLEELTRMLLLDLETYLYSDRDDALYADMALVSMDGMTALVPEVLVPFIGTLGHRRVARAGIRLPLETAVAIDPAGREIRPIHPILDADMGSLASLGGIPSTDGTASRARLDGPTHVDVLISIGQDDVPIKPVSKGLALYRLSSHVENLPMFEDGALWDLKRMVDEARCYELGAGKPAEMLRALVTSFEAS
jgi:hypothetical protein